MHKYGYFLKDFQTLLLGKLQSLRPSSNLPKQLLNPLSFLKQIACVAAPATTQHLLCEIENAPKSSGVWSKKLFLSHSQLRINCIVSLHLQIRLARYEQFLCADRQVSHRVKLQLLSVHQHKRINNLLT